MVLIIKKLHSCSLGVCQNHFQRCRTLSIQKPPALLILALCHFSPWVSWQSTLILATLHKHSCKKFRPFVCHPGGPPPCLMPWWRAPHERWPHSAPALPLVALDVTWPQVLPPWSLPCYELYECRRHVLCITLFLVPLCHSVHRMGLNSYSMNEMWSVDTISHYYKVSGILNIQSWPLAYNIYNP